MTALLTKTIRNHEDFVVEFNYCDSKGKKTRRVVSPIRFMGNDRFLGLCLSREEPRQFHLNRCEAMEMQPACNYLMPVQAVEIA